MSRDKHPAVAATVAVGVLLTLLVLAGGPVLQAADPAENDRIAQLEAKVAALEGRVAELETLVEPVAAEARARQIREMWKAKARQRMRADSAKYSSDQLREAEQFYQVANKNWRSPEAKASLEKMVALYPDVNRTGCALVYLGQYAEGDEKAALLEQAIKGHSDCFYGNGVQVGPYARYLLGHYKHAIGDAEGAAKQAEWIVENAPKAIDHRGRLLADQIPTELLPR